MQSPFWSNLDTNGNTCSVIHRLRILYPVRIRQRDGSRGNCIPRSCYRHADFVRPPQLDRYISVSSRFYQVSFKYRIIYEEDNCSCVFTRSWNRQTSVCIFSPTVDSKQCWQEVRKLEQVQRESLMQKRRHYNLVLCIVWVRRLGGNSRRIKSRDTGRHSWRGSAARWRSPSRPWSSSATTSRAHQARYQRTQSSLSNKACRDLGTKNPFQDANFVLAGQ